MEMKTQAKLVRALDVQTRTVSGERVLPESVQELPASTAFGEYCYAPSPMQRRESATAKENQPIAQRQVIKPNNTGLPDQLKTGIESLSGMNMDGVKVHYNSSRPAELNALAYAQGRDIHLASGQEQHLPHEAWHVVQQAQGRVRPTMQMKAGMPVNN